MHLKKWQGVCTCNRGIWKADLMKHLKQTAIGQALIKAQAEISQHTLLSLFQSDVHRAARYTLTAARLHFDYSKNFIDAEILKLLLELAEQAGLKDKINALLQGAAVNYTEQKPAWHTALRDEERTDPEIAAELDKVSHWVSELSQKNFRYIVNLGIGGSDLGPALIVEALRPYRVNDWEFYFVSNVDPSALNSVLKMIVPEETLFIVASKSFTTLETLMNAKVAKTWIEMHGLKVENHFFAVTTKPALAENFGISAERIFKFWDWVGGRYSIWSSIGFSVALAVGFKNFSAFLHGAYEMDRHFMQADLAENMPVIMALLSVWYINFWGAQTQAILPYDQDLRLFPDYLQQMIMESNGKQARANGELSKESTAPIIWGQVGTNGQHAFYQLLHQGTVFIPIDFILPMQGHSVDVQQQALLVANCIAQSQALMLGKSAEKADKIYLGNRPSSTIYFDQLTPQTLGALIAAYEHRTYVESILWQINAFDQWGVELGKELTQTLLAAMTDDTMCAQQDASTQALIRYWQHTTRF